MKSPTNDEFSGRELSIDELDAVAGGGLWGWIKHEASAALHWVGSHTGAIGDAIIAAMGGGTVNINITHKQN